MKKWALVSMLFAVLAFSFAVPVQVLASGSAAGTQTAQANPCAGKATNPCAAKGTNPCAAKGANPCAAKGNPCAGKANPCAAKGANPCAAKNPCAGK